MMPTKNVSTRLIKTTIVTLATCFCLVAQAQNVAKPTGIKMGVFDFDIMVQVMPGYAAVDSLLKQYEKDTLRVEYDFNLFEYKRLDEQSKADSAAHKPESVLGYIQQKKDEIAATLTYWQQISQQKVTAKRQILAQPLISKILVAYRKVLETNGYQLILKPGSYEIGSNLDNIFEKVAKELKITLPEQLRSQDGQAREGGSNSPATPKSSSRK